MWRGDGRLAWKRARRRGVPPLFFWAVLRTLSGRLLAAVPSGTSVLPGPGCRRSHEAGLGRCDALEGRRRPRALAKSSSGGGGTERHRPVLATPPSLRPLLCCGQGVGGGTGRLRFTSSALLSHPLCDTAAASRSLPSALTTPDACVSVRQGAWRREDARAIPERREHARPRTCVLAGGRPESPRPPRVQLDRRR